jgi:hypothetical protein
MLGFLQHCRSSSVYCEKLRAALCAVAASAHIYIAAVDAQPHTSVFRSTRVCCSPCALQGSPVVAAVRARLAGIEKEYNELDGVWFMAGSLFNKWVATS